MAFGLGVTYLNGLSHYRAKLDTNYFFTSVKDAVRCKSRYISCTATFIHSVNALGAADKVWKKEVTVPMQQGASYSRLKSLEETFKSTDASLPTNSTDGHS